MNKSLKNYYKFSSAVQVYVYSETINISLTISKYVMMNNLKWFEVKPFHKNSTSLNIVTWITLHIILTVTSNLSII